MRIVIAGGTGFVGAALTEYMAAQGHDLFILTRNPATKGTKKNATYVKWLTEDSNPENELKNIDAVINLAGESINSRWTKERKKEIYDSRIETTERILELMESMSKRPSVFINASAVGFYGTSQKKTFTEEWDEAGRDFLARTVKAWEKTASKAEALGVRTVYARFGLILSDSGGALPKMALPYRMHAGGKVGSGKQWVSWVHLRDAIRIIDFILYKEMISGPVNVTAPKPVKMNDFGKKLGEALDRKHWLPVPGIALRLLLGEMSMLLLSGQKVLPRKLGDAGFTFQFPTLKKALRDLF